MDNYFETAQRMQKSSKILFDNNEYHNFVIFQDM